MTSTTAPSTRSTVSLPAGAISYRHAGPANGAAVVFVHGFLVNDGLWADVPERLAAAGYRTYAPTWPIGSHTTPMHPGTDLSPRGVAKIILSFLEALDLHEVTLVANDSGGAITQFLLDTDASRIARVVFTNCDAFEAFPPFPFDKIFAAARRPRGLHALLWLTRFARVRTSPLGFGLLARRRFTAAETEPWVMPVLTSAAIRADAAAFVREVRPEELVEVSGRMTEFPRPVLLAWGPDDRFFKIDLARRLERTFPDARIVEMPGCLTFVALDDAEGLAREIAAFLQAGAIVRPVEV